MMTRLRRTVVLAAAGALTAGALTAGALTMAAHAGSAPQTAGDSCQANASTRPSCDVSESVTMPLSASVSVTSQVAHQASVSWTASCVRNGNATSSSGTASGTTPFRAKISLPRGNAANCSLSANVTATGQAGLTAQLMYSLAKPVMIDIPEGANYSGQPVYALRCLTDPGNNPKIRTPVVIRDCEILYSQAWTLSKGELVHGRYCATVKGDGGNGSKVILYTCSRSADQTWTYRARGPEGEYVLKAHGGRLCLTDPRTSTANNTQLIVATCTGANSQRWYTG